MSVWQQVVIPDRSGRPTQAYSGQSGQVSCCHQDLRNPGHPVRDPGSHQQTMLR